MIDDFIEEPKMMLYKIIKTARELEITIQRSLFNRLFGKMESESLRVSV